MKKFWKWLWDRPVLMCIALAVALNTAMEMLSRRSVWEGVQFLALHPVHFLCNILVVLLTLLLALLVKRRGFMLSLVSTIWLGLAIANFILLGYRTTPLAAIDFYILKPVFSILKIYLTPVQMILIVLAFAAVITGIVFIFIKAPKHQALYRGALVSIAMTSLATFGLIHFSIQADATSTSFANLANAYRNYGFAYCFATSLLDTGIDKPEDYSVETMASLAEDIEEETKEDVSPDAQKDSAIFSDSQQEPNIVMVQLESFIDPNRLDGFTYSENPVPFFTWLKERYTSGYLSVPSIGGGTANTEFEVLTGMSLDYFGPGEYPYKTILQQSTCESVAYNLKELGFGTHAIHNNTGTFYDRHLVFPNLGFDTFTSLEYMNHVEKNPLGWAKDTVLTTEILTTLFSTEQRDFIYAISVQPHGKYPSVPLGDEQPITVSSTVLSEDELIPFSYYVNQVYEEDAFLRSLVQTLETCGEPTILVLYGDHLPSISAAEDNMAKGDLLQTEYVIWDNIGLEEQDLDLKAYQLSASILKKLGIQSGFLNSFHQSFAETPRYQEYLELLEYDMLYGKKAVYGGSDGYRPTDMQMGIKPIALEQYRMLGSTLYVFGSEFTPYSRICINGDPADTVFISSGAIKADDLSLEEEDQITVAQVGEDGIFLSETDSLSFSKNTAP
ncbi:MAG TPA: arylsulfatase [Ruminococcaceae bacterium]|nr:arylsulfatase [Oscillospiraceae bacterium]